MQKQPHLDKDADDCWEHCIHPQVIRFVRKKLLKSEKLGDLADFYKLFADSTRLRIIAALSAAELCVCDLSAVLDMKQPTVSHQLRTLKQARIVTARREGKVVFYSLSDDHIRKVVQVGLEHMDESD